MDLQHRSANLIGTNDGDGKSRPSSSTEKEHMFEKVVTPSDVGKLNRLVIPKQFAETYFPFDSSADEKEGLLLNFEDREGKPWRFRYSYWNSSQSYVLTKGWSRFVKDKNLHAGDVVSFHRDRSRAGQTSSSGDLRRRLFIDCHHRPPSATNSSSAGHLHDGRMLTREQYYRSFGAPQLLYRHGAAADVMPWDQIGYYMAGRGDPNAVYFRPRAYTGSVGTEPRARALGSSPVVFKRRLRLFGVNMDCPIMTTESDDDRILSSDDSASTPPNIGASLPRQQYDDPAS